jgi:hypothetical protein
MVLHHPLPLPLGEHFTIINPIKNDSLLGQLMMKKMFLPMANHLPKQWHQQMAFSR